ncbi:hypothetical protein T12_9993 [Trichinella patagoniensis]|uniref:Uncharacterized protein n=1 Tax=Trichinella patagoniensis TaxID=990121 RepID=A0A0V0Z6H9_9BILA|nr:hypothetical protein T12_9993 [Trichinella patagoniensis]
MGSIAIKLNYGLVADRLYGDSSKLIKPQVVLSCSFAHAAVSTFQMVVGPHCHTVDIQKQNFRSLDVRLDVRGGVVGEDAREWLLEVAIGLFTRHKEHLFAASLTQLPCICHGSVDDPKENAKGPFSAFVFDAV